jgi:hypothetical protein
MTAPTTAGTPDLTTENLEADCYEMIAGIMGTERGWSVVEHVEWMRELLQTAIFAIGRTGANHNTKHPWRDLWVHMCVCRDGMAPGSSGLRKLGPVADLEDTEALLAQNAALRDALTLAVSIAESWIHSELDGTSSLGGALDHLKPCHAALALTTK